MSREIAPTLTRWLKGGAIYEVDLDKGMRELRSLKAVARAADRIRRVDDAEWINVRDTARAIAAVRNSLARLHRQPSRGSRGPGRGGGRRAPEVEQS